MAWESCDCAVVVVGLGGGVQAVTVVAEVAACTVGSSALVTVAGKLVAANDNTMIHHFDIAYGL